MGDPSAETTQHTPRAKSLPGRTRIQCTGADMTDDCKAILIDLADGIAAIDRRLDKLTEYIYKGDPEKTARIAVTEDRVRAHSRILGAVGLAILGQIGAIFFALLK